MGLTDRLDQRNQRRLDSDAERLSNENWQRAIDDDPVPKWVYGVQAIPVIGRVVDVVAMVLGAIRVRRDRKNSH